MAEDPTQDINQVAPTKKERVIGGLAGAVAGATGVSSGGVDDAIQKHQQMRLDEARMHRKNFSTYSAILASGKTPDGLHDLTEVDPKTGRTYEEQYENWKQSAAEAYSKAAGINKETKGMVQKGLAAAEHIIGLGRKQRDAGGAQGGAAAGGTAGAQAGLPPPPQRTTVDAGTLPAGTKRTAGPEGMTAEVAPEGGSLPSTMSVTGGLTPPPGYTPQVAMGGDALRQQVDDNRAVELYKRKEQVLYDNKVREDAAKAKARQQATPRPVKSNAISVLDARTLAGDGKIFVDGEGQPIDVNELPETMGLISFVVKNPDNGQWETVYQPFSPNQTTLTVGGESYAISPMDKSKVVQGKGTDVGAHNIPSTSSTYDPTTGQTTTTKRVPTVSGAAGRGGLTPPPSGQTRSGTAPAQKSTGAAARPGAAGSTIPVDSEGHISSAYKGATPQVIEAANQLIDDRDVDKIPAKVRELGAALARKTGWSQGKFNPKEMTLLRESTTFLDEALKNPSLSALDDSFIERQKLSAVLANPDKEGFIGRGMSSAAAMNLSPKQQEFVRMYNQLVGTISGLSQLVRSGKATEAQIERLKAELPNPTTTANSADAIKRLQRLRKEVDVALTKGSFIGGASESASKLPGPPKGGAATTAPQRQKWGRDANNNPIPLPAPASP